MFKNKALFFIVRSKVKSFFLQFDTLHYNNPPSHDLTCSQIAIQAKNLLESISRLSRTLCVISLIDISGIQ